MIKRVVFVFLLFLFIFSATSCKDSVLYIEEDILIHTGEYAMEGILTIPNRKDDNFPAVVLVGGSGPTDMNSSVGKLKPFKDIASGLAKSGIASIRYHKRTYQYQNELKTDYRFTPKDEYIDDAISAIELLANDERIDHNNIFLLGHSQGGQFAPVIANQTDKLKGIIIMAGITIHILDLLMEQVLNNYGLALYSEYIPFYQAAIAIDQPDQTKENWHYFGAYYHYWLVYNKFDFEAELIESANNHVILVMQGGKDLQVYPKYFDRYIELVSQNEKSTIKHIKFDNLNHMFVDGGDETIQTAYSKKKTVDQSVIDSMIDFISTR